MDIMSYAKDQTQIESLKECLKVLAKKTKTPAEVRKYSL